MSDQYEDAAEAMRNGTDGRTVANGADNASNVQSSVSRQRGSAVRSGVARLDGVVSTSGGAHSDPQFIHGGGQRSSGARGADGGPFWNFSGGELGSGPRFDAKVPPGGYLWWYVDGLSDCGRYGVSIISFVGSVFSPYYAWKSRKDPDDHVCINVALYAPGGNRWSMTERGRASSSRSHATFRVGPSDLHWQDGILTLKFDELSLPWPSTSLLPKRIKGTLKLTAGAITDQAYQIDGQGKHMWWPIAPSSRLSIAFDGGDLPDWEGHGYMDCNWGLEGLEDGFVRWDWARGEMANGDTVVLYDTSRCDGSHDCLFLRIGNDGQATRFEMPPRASLGRGYWGVERRSHAERGHDPYVLQKLEDSPFYARCVVQTHLLGEPVTLMHETLDGKRFANPLVKAMLPWRMPRRA